MITPKGQKVLIKPDALPEKTEGGLYKPKEEVPTTGTVEAISEDILDAPVQLGSRVKYLPNHRIEEEGGILVDLESILWVFNE